jgi:hypothetical protein
LTVEAIPNPPGAGFTQYGYVGLWLFGGGVMGQDRCCEARALISVAKGEEATAMFLLRASSTVGQTFVVKTSMAR